MKKIVLVAFSLVVLTLSVQAQDIKTSSIAWNSTNVFNPVTGELSQGQNTVVSNSATSVEWQKPDGTTIQFNVVEVVGQWTNVNNNGQIIYEVSNADTNGNITFTKTSAVTRIRLLLIKGEDEPVVSELSIDNYQVQ
jgi:hypothetical protein